MSGRHIAAEGRTVAAVTHLALLGVKIAGNGILGFTKEIFEIRKRISDVQKIFRIHRITEQNTQDDRSMYQREIEEQEKNIT